MSRAKKPGAFFSGITALPEGLHGYITVDFSPGNYLLICYVPDVRDGKPHYQHGMYRHSVFRREPISGARRMSRVV